MAKIKTDSAIDPRLIVAETVNKHGLKVYFGKTPQQTYVFTPSGEQLGNVFSVEYKADTNNIVPIATFNTMINIISEKEKDKLLKVKKHKIRGK